MRPKSFGSFEKQAPSLVQHLQPEKTVRLGWQTCTKASWNAHELPRIVVKENVRNIKNSHLKYPLELPIGVHH